MIIIKIEIVVEVVIRSIAWIISLITTYYFIAMNIINKEIFLLFFQFGTWIFGFYLAIISLFFFETETSNNERKHELYYLIWRSTKIMIKAMIWALLVIFTSIVSYIVFSYFQDQLSNLFNLFIYSLWVYAIIMCFYLIIFTTYIILNFIDKIIFMKYKEAEKREKIDKQKI